jgi:hypothetical protein
LDAPWLEDGLRQRTGGFVLVTGVAGGGDWQQQCTKDFATTPPGSLGLTIGLFDPLQIAGVGSGDVMAELVPYLSNDDQSGNGHALAAAYPDLVRELIVRLKIN